MVAWRQRASAALRSGSACVLLNLAATAAWAAPPEPEPLWASLSPAQQQALAPLQREWATVDSRRKQKWLEVSSRYAAMPREEQARMQARMVQWLALSPTERARARSQFQELKEVPADEREARWRAYQALSPDERARLAKDARPPSKAPAAVETPQALRRTSTATRNSSAAPSAARLQAKPATPPPLAVQATPGATTNTPTARPKPPLHHHAGLPKIAATPGFVDPATLLPQRGPQGAAVHSAPAAAPPGPAARR